jgi:hypothetical protein
LAIVGTLLGLTTKKKTPIAARWVSATVIPRPVVVALPISG